MLTVCGTAAVLVASSCGSGDTTAERADRTTTTTTTTPPTEAAVYAEPGPNTVGYTTLHMDDRFVDVWYPADDAAAADTPKATYDQRATLPVDLRGFVPEEYNTVVTMEAHADVAGSTDGPFPVVLFSHGATAYRMASSGLLAGIASWGFVVVSADYLERGVVTQLPGQAPLTLDPARDKGVMLASLDLVAAENDRSASVLHGIVDATSVAAVGHSAGGTTAFDALGDARVKAAVGWASLGPSAPVPKKPTMIIGAANDLGIKPAVLSKTYESLPAPKRRIEIADAGHNSFTDLCVVTESGGGMVGYGIESGAIPKPTAKLLLNGCERSALAPEAFWPVVQHFTVAEVRAALGIDTPAGLDAAMTCAFPGIVLTYEQQP